MVYLFSYLFFLPCQCHEVFLFNFCILIRVIMSFTFNELWTVDPKVQACQPSAAVGNLHVTCSWPHIYAVPLYLQFLCIHCSASLDSANTSLCSTEVFTTEKDPHISGPLQFKSVLYKGQLYLCLCLCLLFVFCLFFFIFYFF